MLLIKHDVLLVKWVEKEDFSLSQFGKVHELLMVRLALPRIQIYATASPNQSRTIRTGTAHDVDVLQVVLTMWLSGCTPPWSSSSSYVFT